jgi:hypothetical protein
VPATAAAPHPKSTNPNVPISSAINLVEILVSIVFNFSLICKTQKLCQTFVPF